MMSDSSNTSMIIEDVDLNRALEQIRELNTELSMHGDALAQVGALQKRIASTKGRARGLVNMIDQRIAYLSDAWKTHLSDKGDYEDLEIAKGAVSDPVRIGLHKDGDESFFARVNILKDKVAELVLLDEQAAVAHKRATADNKTLNVAADMLKEVEDRQRELLANNEHCFSEKALPLPSLRRALEAIDARLNLKDTTAEEKSDLKMLAEELRLFLKFLPNSASGTTLTPQSKVTSTSELRTSLAPTETTNSSSLISGTTVPTNESLSGFTTSTGTSASASATNGYQMQADGQSLPNSDSNSTMPI